MEIEHRRDLGRYYKGIAIHAAPLVHEQAFALLSEYLPPRSTVIDLGTGSGAFAMRLSDHGYFVEAADFNVPAKQPGRTRILCQDLNAPVWDCLRDKSYECATALEVIEHLENPSQFLRNVRRLLKPGALFLLTTPNVVDLNSRRLMITKGEYSLFGPEAFVTGHLSILPFWLLEQLFAKEGFEIIARKFIGRNVRTGLRKLIAPLVNLSLLPLGYKIPLEAAFGVCVAFLCKVAPCEA